MIPIVLDAVVLLAVIAFILTLRHDLRKLAGEIRENRAKEINSVRDTEETKAKECVQDWIDTYEDIRSDNMDTTEVQECLTKWNPGTPHGR